MTLYEKFEKLDRELEILKWQIIRELQIERLVRWLNEKIKGMSL